MSITIARMPASVTGLVLAMSMAIAWPDRAMAGSQACGADGIFANGFEPGATLHPLYPGLDLATLPGAGGSASGPYRPPVLPCTTRSVVVTGAGVAAANQLRTECAIPGSAVEVPSAAGRIGVFNLGHVEDCDITLGSEVVIDYLVIGSQPGPTHAPSHRIRIRGGQIGSMLVVGPSTDIVFDSVAINNGVVPSSNRPGAAIYLAPGPGSGQFVDGFAVVNSFIRMLPVASGADIDGAAHLSDRASNQFFANNNIVTAGNRNAWGFRFDGGDNLLVVDNTVRVSFHKLIRMGAQPVDYVYVKGGVWMREATSTAGGLMLNDAFAQLSSTTDRVYIHGPEVYLLAPTQVSFGTSVGPAQSGRSWQVRDMVWHATTTNAVSAQWIQTLEGLCIGVGGLCDYGVATHDFHYDPALVFPVDPWRDLPDFANDDPDALPVMP